MIQRIQTLFLLASGLVLILFVFSPVWSFTKDITGDSAVLTAMVLTMKNKSGGIVFEENTVYLAALSLFSALVSLFSIFKFRQRTLQYKLGLFNLLLISVLVGLSVFDISKGQHLLGIEEAGDFHIAFFLPLMALVCTLFANRFIRKDDKLVRSMDRLR